MVRAAPVTDWMKMQVHAEPHPLFLPQSMDLTRADALHGAVQACVAGDTIVRLNGSAVEYISTACLQILVAAAVATRGQSRSFIIDAPSEVLRTAARDLALAEMLGMGAG